MYLFSVVYTEKIHFETEIKKIGEFIDFREIEAVVSNEIGNRTHIYILVRNLIDSDSIVNLSAECKNIYGIKLISRNAHPLTIDSIIYNYELQIKEYRQFLGESCLTFN